MATINPISRLREDVIKILNSLVIKYNAKAEECETVETKKNAVQYINALNGTDKFQSYTSYTSIDIKNNRYIESEGRRLHTVTPEALGYFENTIIYPVYDEAIDYSDLPYYEQEALLTPEDLEEYNDIVNLYTSVPNTIPEEYKSDIFKNRHDRVIDEYEEGNNYYRSLLGLPDLNENGNISSGCNTKDIFTIEAIPENNYRRIILEYIKDVDIVEVLHTPLHEIEKKFGSFVMSIVESSGIVDYLISENPDVEYLKHLGHNKLDLRRIRTANNFEILSLDQTNIIESTYRQFIQSYELCRSYFVSIMYNRHYSNLIDYYDNFIALCIFVMTIQQLSAKAIENSNNREFYDPYSVQLLYETYGIPYNDKIDEVTQKQIVQNLNLLVQNKATDKVILDIASILGFNDIKLYEYYLVKKRLFDENGFPLVVKKEKINDFTGEIETTYDWEKMYDLYFQRVDMKNGDIYKDINNALNKYEYNEIVSNDPYWWNDDQLVREIWETEYNYMETKYMSGVIPYKMTDLWFQSIILLRMMLNLGQDINNDNLLIDIPRITKNKVSLLHVFILLCALLSKKHHMNGDTIVSFSKALGVNEYNYKELEKSEENISILNFNYSFFNSTSITDTIRKIRDNYFIYDKYFINTDDIETRYYDSDDFTGTYMISNHDGSWNKYNNDGTVVERNIREPDQIRYYDNTLNVYYYKNSDSEWIMMDSTNGSMIKVVTDETELNELLRKIEEYVFDVKRISYDKRCRENIEYAVWFKKDVSTMQSMDSDNYSYKCIKNIHTDDSLDLVNISIEENPDSDVDIVNITVNKGSMYDIELSKICENNLTEVIKVLGADSSSIPVEFVELSDYDDIDELNLLTTYRIRIDSDYQFNIITLQTKTSIQDDTTSDDIIVDDILTIVINHHSIEKQQKILNSIFLESKDIYKEDMNHLIKVWTNDYKKLFNPSVTLDEYISTHMDEYMNNSNNKDDKLKKLEELLLRIFEIHNIHTEESTEELISLINQLADCSREFYEFISYRMSITTDKDEYYALKTLFESLYYSNELHEIFKFNDGEDDKYYSTFNDYLKYNNPELYTFVDTVNEDLIYDYIDHIIYKLEELEMNVSELYKLNNGFSPLEDFLHQLILFFKSFTVDFISLGSYMVLDFKTLNMLKLIDDVTTINKTLQFNRDTERMDLYDVLSPSVIDRDRYINYLVNTRRMSIEDATNYYENHFIKGSIWKVIQPRDEFLLKDYLKIVR